MIAGDEISLDEALAWYLECLDNGESVDEASLIARYPQHGLKLKAFFADQRQINGQILHLANKTISHNQLAVRCPNCFQSTQVAVDSTLSELVCSSCGSHFSLVDDSEATVDSQQLKVGRFQLTQRLGVGAFGSVWKAQDDVLDRSVAVKVPRQGSMSADEQEKFIREARAAAQLRHPNIVSVHEVGRDGSSVYIVSDFVQGVDMADWLTTQQPTSHEAIRWCMTICDALEHAHNKGVIHRDLKPANIMIDADGNPHLMDFGLARRDTGEVTVTLDGHVLGTPAYMSPEQAGGRSHDADRRSDVYSLGVILFQLLTGELPFRGNARMMLHQVLHDEPPSLRKLNANIKRDLETITLKCLEKEPGRRYKSAKEVGDDLLRFSSGQPIQARPIGKVEQAVRWVQRNKLVSALAATIFFVLLTGIIVSSLFAISAQTRAKEALAAQERADESRQEAVTKQEEAEAVTNFLVSAFKSPHPGKTGRDVKLVEILTKAGKDLEKTLPDQPQAQATLLHAIGSSWLGLGLWKEAVRDSERALMIRRKALGETHSSTVLIMMQLAYAYRCQGQLEKSTELYEEALQANRRRTSEPNEYELTIMQAIAVNYRYLNRIPKAIELTLEVIDKSRELLGDDHSNTLIARENLANAYSAIGQHEDAVQIQEDVTSRWLKNFPGTSYATNAEAGLAAKYHNAGRYDDAIELYLKIVPKQEEQIGPDHPDALNSKGMLASTYRKAGRFDEAIPLYEEVYEARKKLLGLDDDVTRRAMVGLMMTYQSANHTDDMLKLYDETKDALGKNPETLNAIAWTLATSGNNKLSNGKRAIDIATKACELTNYEDPSIVDTLAAAYAQADDLDNAVKWSEKSIELAQGSKNDQLRAALQQSLDDFRSRRDKESKAIEADSNGSNAGSGTAVDPTSEPLP